MYLLLVYDLPTLSYVCIILCNLHLACALYLNRFKPKKNTPIRLQVPKQRELNFSHRISLTLTLELLLLAALSNIPPRDFPLARGIVSLNVSIPEFAYFQYPDA